MKTLALWIFLLPFTIAHAATGEEMLGQTRAASVGQPAPAGALDTVDGKRIELGDLYGRKPVYLKFWATWCVPCRQQMPHFQAAWQRYHDSVEIVAVNLGLNDDVQDVRDFLSKTKLSMPVAIDSAGDLATAFGIVVTPVHVLIDADGRIAYVGHEANADLDRALEQVSRSRPHAKAVSERRQVAPGRTTKPTVLAFITPWCESYLKESRPEVASACTKTREAMMQAYRAAPEQASWRVVASRVWATDADVEAYKKKYQLAYPVMLDASGELFRLFAIKEVPTVLIVEADGTIRRRFDGFSADLAGALASLNAGPSAKKSTTLLTDPLPKLDGKEVVMLTVDVPPGGTSPPHRHNGHVYVYMLEGSMVMKTRDGPETTVRAGQHFVERPQDIHMVSRNPSTTAPARFLAVIVKDAGAPVSVALDAH